MTALRISVLVGSMLLAALFVAYGTGSVGSAPASPGPAPAPSPGPSPAPASPSPGAVVGPTVHTVTLNIAQESPAPRPETPRAAAGVGAVVINAARTEVGFAVSYSGLSGPLAQSHFHRGAPGEAGPVVQTICGGPPPVIVSACPTGAAGTLAGVWMIPQSLVADWQAGRIYINLHTAMNPGGEIRGQISTAPR